MKLLPTPPLNFRRKFKQYYAICMQLFECSTKNFAIRPGLDSHQKYVFNQFHVLSWYSQYVWVSTVIEKHLVWVNFKHPAILSDWLQTDAKMFQPQNKNSLLPTFSSINFLEKRGATSHSPQLSPIDSELMPKFYHLLCEQVGNSDIKI